ncbi:MAG: MarR family winged helix-turn-helix transcriptional regulator [bacterium]|jgi:MarR family 2-MHQ and catechol resistance regulon transcriptional repressor
MGIENEIQQFRFTGENQKALINLMYTYHWVTERLKTILSENDITLQQYNILRILRGSDPKPLSTLNIRERMLDKMSDTSRIVDRLMLKGLVDKKNSKADKRLVDVSITEEGKKLLEDIDKKDDAMTGIIGNLNQDELMKLNQILDKLRETT